MKKNLISILMVFVLLMNVTACNRNQGGGSSSSKSSSSTSGTKPNPDATKTVYDVLNGLSKQNYGKIKLNITTETGDMQLKAEYVLTDRNVSYSVEQMNLLPEDGNLNGLSPDTKQTMTGTATVENGKITKIDGDKVTVPAYGELKGSFDFKEGYFSNVRSTDGEFSADVKSTSDFLGTDRALTDMTLEVEYNDSALEKITLVYKTANSTVTTTYEFER